MDVWYLPFQISACYDSFVVSDKRNQGTERTVCETSLQQGMNLVAPGVAIRTMSPSDTLYIEGHGKRGSDLIFEKSKNASPLLLGPRNEYMDAFRLARSLKHYGYKGGPIRLAVCHSAEENGFGSHLAKAMKLYGISFKSVRAKVS